MKIDAGPISCFLERETADCFHGTKTSLPDDYTEITITKNLVTEGWRCGERVLFRAIMDTVSGKFAPVRS